MRIYILTGGIGSGKSSVSALLAGHGACTLDLDEVGHDVLADEDVRERLVGRFGQGILADDGSIDRPALAKRAFATAADTADLNAITHPAILERAWGILEQMRQRGCEVAIVEASAYEGPGGAFDPLVEAADGVIVVTAPVQVRIDRAAERGAKREDVAMRIERQPSDAQRQAWGTCFIDNSGTLAQLDGRVDELWAQMEAQED